MTLTPPKGHLFEEILLATDRCQISIVFRLWDEEGQRLVGYRFPQESFKVK